MKLQKKTLRKV